MNDLDISLDMMEFFVEWEGMIDMSNVLYCYEVFNMMCWMMNLIVDGIRDMDWILDEFYLKFD